MNVEIINHTKNPEFAIVNAARICYNSPCDSIFHGDGSVELGDRDKKLLLKLVGLKHFSTIEHAYFTFKITGISRACSHQLVRHRIASYSQRSQRYVSEVNFDYIIPAAIADNEEANSIYKSAMESINEHYTKLMSINIKKEDARYLLPNACATELVMTVNARSLMNFFELRLDKHSQWEIRALASKMYASVNKLAPILFPVENNL
ncbi:MAG TPA: FAD-dependent thymidylate synthase [bacterium]|nr:FAD-dependent thymidylate synthase [bacterium]HPN30438.1 FAD-dependent thymidylate synthase [bacterium]